MTTTISAVFEASNRSPVKNKTATAAVYKKKRHRMRRVLHSVPDLAKRKIKPTTESYESTQVQRGPLYPTTIRDEE